MADEVKPQVQRTRKAAVDVAGIARLVAGQLKVAEAGHHDEVVEAR